MLELFCHGQQREHLSASARLDAPRDMLTAVSSPDTELKMNALEVWFDGSCPLCLREISLMRRLDWKGAIVFIDAARPDAVCPLDRKELLARFHASEDGIMLSGAAAFAAMWRAIPLLKPLGCAARSPVILAALEALYRRFLRVRPKLQQALR